MFLRFSINKTTEIGEERSAVDEVNLSEHEKVGHPAKLGSVTYGENATIYCRFLHTKKNNLQVQYLCLQSLFSPNTSESTNHLSGS